MTTAFWCVLIAGLGDSIAAGLDSALRDPAAAVERIRRGQALVARGKCSQALASARR